MRIVPIDGWEPLKQKETLPTRKGKKAHDRGREHDEGHLDLIRRLPCIITKLRGEGIQAAHLRLSDAEVGKLNAGGGARPSDSWTLPLHHTKHEEQHQGGEAAFWVRHGIDDPLEIASRLYDLSCSMRHAGCPQGEILKAMEFLMRRALGRKL